MTGKKRLVAGLGLVLTFAWVAPAAAYIGPGAGLSLLGALWGVFAAIFAALLFLLIWPLRRLLRRNRQAPIARQQSVETELGQGSKNPRID
ncbi:hypothetical protein HBA54_02405 [Pelagibius litoralis]|uniref:Uncharacterized protein n=1 Tax=Pelagibius litoralis TaxID=374515 RepID=A0A967C2Y7_9PROT|nr:hypothetical protein [Pelagibius litoralis]NIA67434.1 hypothetical protein [Pelagibius litoralis]